MKRDSWENNRVNMKEMRQIETQNFKKTLMGLEILVSALRKINM